MFINKSKITSLIFLILFGFLTTTGFSAEKRAMTVEDMWAMKRIGATVLSPDGLWIAFAVTEYDMDSNGSNTDIYLVSTKNDEIKKVTTSPNYDGAPAWHPSGKKLAFISTREGYAQIYCINLSGDQ